MMMKILIFHIAEVPTDSMCDAPTRTLLVSDSSEEVVTPDLTVQDSPTELCLKLLYRMMETIST